MISIRDVAHKYAENSQLGLIELSNEQIKIIQSISLKMYKDIDAVCKKRKITVLLAGGTILGAVRHQGFIPWDDDMDLMMPREDFNEFMKIFQEELGDKYYLACPNRKYSKQNNYIMNVIDKKSWHSDIFAREKFYSQGFVIDIGAIDYVPDNIIHYYIKGWLANILIFTINSNMIYHCRTDVSKKLLTVDLKSCVYYYGRIFWGFVASILPFHKWCKIFDSFISSSKPHKRVSIPSGRNHYFGETREASVFFPLKDLPFEDVICKVPNDYNEYLKKQYGSNYMEIPPEKKRERHLCTSFKVEL